MESEHQINKALDIGHLLHGHPSSGKNIRLDTLPTNDWDSDWHQEQQAQYALISSSFITKCVYEEYPTVTTLGQIMVIHGFACQ
jgi:hypothetical protein